MNSFSHMLYVVLAHAIRGDKKMTVYSLPITGGSNIEVGDDENIIIQLLLWFVALESSAC